MTDDPNNNDFIDNLLQNNPHRSPEIDLNPEQMGEYLRWRAQVPKANKMQMGLVIFGPSTAPMGETMAALQALSSIGAEICNFMELGDALPWAAIPLAPDPGDPLALPSIAAQPWLNSIHKAVPTEGGLGAIFIICHGSASHPATRQKALSKLMALSKNLVPGQVLCPEYKERALGKMGLTIWPTSSPGLSRLLRTSHEQLLSKVMGEVVGLFSGELPGFQTLQMSVQVQRMARSSTLQVSDQSSPAVVYRGDKLKIQAQNPNRLHLQVLLQSNDRLQLIEQNSETANFDHFEIALGDRPGEERPILLASQQPVTDLKQHLNEINRVVDQSWQARLEALVDRLHPTPIALLYHQAYDHRRLALPVDQHILDSAHHADEKGHLERAKTLYEQLISHPKLIAHRADLRTRLANVLRRQRQFDEALKLATQAELEAHRMQDLSTAGAAARVSGRILLSTGQLELAWPALSRALELHRSAQDLFGEMEDHLNIAIAHWSVSQLEQALLHYRQVLLPAKQTRSWRVFAMANQGLGQVCHDLGRLFEAQNYYQEAITAFKRIADDRGQAAALGDIGLLALWREEHEQALAHFDEQLLVARRLSSPAYLRFALVNKAQALRHLQRLGEARACLLESLRLKPDPKSPLFKGLHLELGDIALATGSYDEAEQHLSWIDPQDTGLMVDFRWRGALAKARLQSALGDPDAEQHYQRGIAVLEDVRGNLPQDLRLQFLDASRALWDGWIDALCQSTDNLALLSALERSSARTFVDALLSSKPLDADNKQSLWGQRGLSKACLKRLPQHSAYIQSYVLEDRLIVLWIFQGQCTRHIAPVGRQALSRAVEELQVLCSTDQTPIAAIRPAMRLLSSWLIDPLEKQLQALPEETPLCFLPAGPLAGLPLHALPLANGQPLITRHPVSYAPGLTAIITWAEQHKEVTGKPLLMADARSDLGHARREVQDVKRILGQGEILEGQAATASALWNLGPDASLIHLAVHATHHEDGHGSCLQLAPDTDANPSDDGSVDAVRLKDLKLKALLVVLSACYSGGGQLSKSGEGQDLLVWAFLMSGARQVIANHWQVHDETSARLMHSFYEKLHGGTSPVLALAQAQRELLKDDHPAKSSNARGGQLLTPTPMATYSHPYYWAGFFITGATD